MLNPLWGDDWEQVRAQWTLDPTVTFLNHGSFGAAPRSVIDAQRALRDEMESQPVRFLDRELPARIADVRDEVAAFLDADAGGLVFVRNTTTGVGAVLGSLRLAAGDEVVITDQSYGAVRLAVARACAARDARMVEVAVSPGGADAATAVAGALTDATRLVIADHIVSVTGAIWDAAAIVAACRARRVPIMIDAAHAPGQVPVSVRTLDADLWVGNLHKWVCAPKGAAALWVGPAWRERVTPVVTSHGAGAGLHREFDWTGTDDPTAVLAIPAALRFMADLGWERVIAYNHAVAVHARSRLAEALGTDPLVHPDAMGALASVPLGIDLPDKAAGDALQAIFYANERIEVPLMVWKGRGIVRASAQVYNHPDEYDRLARALVSLLAARGARTA